MLNKLTVWVCAVLVLGGCASSNTEVADLRGPAPPGQIYDVAAGVLITEEQLVASLRQKDYILLGEEHGEPTHHKRQNRILQLLIDSGSKPAVVFEMFNREDSGIIASAARSFPGEPDRIANAVKWDESGWPDWQWYRPIVETVLSAKLPIVAGNISRPMLKEIVFGNGDGSIKLTDRMLQTYGLTQALPEQQGEHLKTLLAVSHGGDMPEWVVEGYLRAQRVRDASMADSMITRNNGEGVVLIAGHQHARTDYGVPFYLRFREPGARIASLAFIDDGTLERLQTTNINGVAHDYVWIMPSIQGVRTVEK